MSVNLHAGNISSSMTEEALKDLFKVYGNVLSVKIVKDKYTGISKGFGFVEMENLDDAHAAIDIINGKNIIGKNIKIKISV
jgi:RNA recognition motif-containing protein